MPACSPRRGSGNGPVRPNFSSNNSRPSRGAKPREAYDTKTFLGAGSPGWLPRSRDIYARCTSRGSHDVSHDDQGQAGASGRSVPVSSLVLRRLSVSWERAYTDLPTCGPWRGSASVPVWPIFISEHSRASRGAKPHEADDTRTSLGGGLTRLAPEERIYQCKVHVARFT